MRRIVLVMVLAGVLGAGCEGLRFAPGEKQRQNAWLHNRTAEVAADRARRENVSEPLRALTELSARQSGAFVSYFGLPKELPAADTVEQILGESNSAITEAALRQSRQRPDLWQSADSAFELGIGLFALLGGVYGTRAVRFLTQARDKSRALKEIIRGNELFKRRNAQAKDAFKLAQQNQSAVTRQIVAAMKG